MSNTINITLKDEQDTEKFAQILAKYVPSGIVFLIGDLGAGKTTLTRYWLQALGHEGAVKSPTYTLVEPYQLKNNIVYHFDLYRLNDPYELELIGIRDYFEEQNSLSLIEWPSKGELILPEPSLSIAFSQQHNDRVVELSLPASSNLANNVLESIQGEWHA